MQQLGSAPRVTSDSCNLHEAIRSAMASVRAARGDGVELIEEFDPSLPAVTADHAALVHVLINLFDNACDACSGAINPRVEVRTRFVSGLVYNVIRLGKATRLPVEIVVRDYLAGTTSTATDNLNIYTNTPNGYQLYLNSTSGSTDIYNNIPCRFAYIYICSNRCSHWFFY